MGRLRAVYLKAQGGAKYEVDVMFVCFASGKDTHAICVCLYVFVFITIVKMSIYVQKRKTNG